MSTALSPKALRKSRLSHSEAHMAHRTGWRRAAVLGANDGLVSTASLVVGVAAAGSGRPGILIDGLVAGPMSMTAGEFVSVSLQTNADQAEIARETGDLKETPEADLDELTRIHAARGLEDGLARQAAMH
jgi:VIT1/CCC1 family predicted Fe2+/Mn2+ transporter